MPKIFHWQFLKMKRYVKICVSIYHVFNRGEINGKKTGADS